jgi:tRNA A-37 threonylcarbamoyl transferase component Bud32
VGTAEDEAHTYLATNLDLLSRNCGLRVEDTSNAGYLDDTRKPDFSIFEQSAPLTQLHVVAVLDAKPRRSVGQFSPDQKGKIIGFGDVILKVQPWRPHVFCALSDGCFIQFFKIARQGKEDVRVYGETAVEGVRKGQAGYAHLCSLFAASAIDLGFSLPSVAFVKFPTLVPDKYLGRGATSKVFLAKQGGTEYAVKMFDDACQGLVTDEAKVLDALKGIDGIPRLEDVSPNSLLMTPVCSRYKVVDGESVSQLIDIVKAVHDEGYVHRDIRPPNLLQTTDGCIVLADWGFAAVKNSTAKYVGTLHTASDAVLLSVGAQSEHCNTARRCFFLIDTHICDTHHQCSMARCD